MAESAEPRHVCWYCGEDLEPADRRDPAFLQCVGCGRQVHERNLR